MQTGKMYRYEKTILYPRNWLLREKSRYEKTVQSEKLQNESSLLTGKKVRYDACCKRILSEKIIVAWIMKYCIPEYRNFAVEEIAEKFIEGMPSVGISPVHADEAGRLRIHGDNTEDSSLYEGNITYDIKFRAILPDTGKITEMLINIEAQNNFYPGYPLIKRALYYCCRMISSQHGTEFGKGHYERIKKVYSIWICMNPPQVRENSITRYEIQEENIIGKVSEKKNNYDLLAAVMICLGKCTKAYNNGNDTEEQELLRMLQVLFSKELSAEEKKAVLEDDFSLAMTEKLEGEIDEMCNLSEGIWREAMTKGIEQGIEQGLNRGVERGMRKTVLNFVRKKMLAGKELSQIAAELDESEEYLAPFYRLVKENPELSVEELATKA